MVEKNRLVSFSTLGAAFFLFALSGCRDPGDRDGGARQFSDGEEVFVSPMESGNSFACNSCHALSEPADDGLLRPGHPLANAPLRSSFKNGQLDSFLDAVNSCLDEWMTADPWTEDTREFQLVRDLLLEADPEASSEELSYEIVTPPPLEALMEGDPEAGQELFNQSCSVCHGANGVGTIRAPVVTGFGVDPELAAERIRLSGRSNSAVYEGLTGGRMPFWAADRLSDQDVADLVMYLTTSESDNTPGAFTPNDPPPNLPPVVSCAATHERVGDSLTLREFNHDVGGTVTVVDNCTLRFEDFTFDGRGVNVQIYGAQNRNYDNGFSMSADLRRDTAYRGATFEINLPEGVTLDDFNSISVWCVPVGQNFGDGEF